MINWSNLSTQQKWLSAAVVLALLALLLFSNYVSRDELIARLLVLLISFPVHELAHAVVADRLGDPTPRYYGRITLNPLRHLDPVGSAMMLLLGFGWATTPVNPGRLRGNQQLSSILVSVAGPLSNLALAAMAGLFIQWVPVDNRTVFIIAANFVYINVLLFIFNLLPIPPLDGFNILANLLPAEMRQTLLRIAPYGSILLLALIILPGNLLGTVIYPPVEALSRLLLGF